MQDDAVKSLGEMIFAQQEKKKQNDVSKMLAKDSKASRNLAKNEEFESEPHRNRTCNLLIKSQLLCQLS